MPTGRFAFDHTGETFGKLKAIRIDRNDNGRIFWLVRCSCGREKSVRAQHLRDGAVTSCGRGECRSMRRHGMSEKQMYVRWVNIVQRCTNPKHPRFKDYGGRGIGVCERWRTSFEAFWNDMGEPILPGLTVDRIDNEKGYEPGNCRWATYGEQNWNRRAKK